MGVITPIASNSWMVYLMEHPISIDTLGGTPFQETPVGMQYIGRDIISYNMFLIATPRKMPISCRTWNIRRKHHSSLVFTTYSGQLFGGPVYYITTWVWDKICQNGMRRGQFFFWKETNTFLLGLILSTPWDLGIPTVQKQRNYTSKPMTNGQNYHSKCGFKQRQKLVLSPTFSTTKPWYLMRMGDLLVQ